MRPSSVCLLSLQLYYVFSYFFMTILATPESSTLSLHDALPICHRLDRRPLSARHLLRARFGSTIRRRSQSPPERATAMPVSSRSGERPRATRQNRSSVQALPLSWDCSFVRSSECSNRRRILKRGARVTKRIIVQRDFTARLQFRACDVHGYLTLGKEAGLPVAGPAFRGNCNISYLVPKTRSHPSTTLAKRHA